MPPRAKDSMMFQIACFSTPPADKRELEYFWAYLNLTAASFKFHSPKTRTILLTTQPAEVPEGLNIDRIHRLPESDRLNKGLMVDEVQGWLDFVKSDLFDRPTILVDPDLLLQRDPAEAFEQDFDVGLTWRDISNFRKPRNFNETANEQPINAGMISLNPGRKDAVIRFFERCLEDLLSLDSKYWNWYGDQECLHSASGSKSDNRYMPDIRDVGGVRVRHFLCNEYNFSQPFLPDGSPNPSHFPEPHIIHFKGYRKHLMFQYANNFLGIQFQQDEKAPGTIRILLN